MKDRNLDHIIGTIEVPVWARFGGMIVRRDSLDPSHPQSTYSYIKKGLGLIPEDYGYYSAELSEEQTKLLRSIPDVAIFAEASRREDKIIAEELYG